MEIIAHARHLRISPRKVRKMADLVRMHNAHLAKSQLLHLPYRSSRPLAKLIDAALHNAKNNFGIEGTQLYIKKITVDGGPVGKRFRPGAAGRTNPYTKRTSHVTLVLDDRSGTIHKALHKVSHVHDAPQSHVEKEENISAHKEAHPAIKKNKFASSDKKIASAQSKGGVRKIFQRKAIG